MKINKAVLIEPETTKFIFFNHTQMPLLGLPILGTIMKNRGIEVKIFCENVCSLDWAEIKSADIVGLTVLTILAPRAYELAEKIKRVNPTCKIIMGGVHVTFRPQEALDNGADFVVRKEGEKTLDRLLTCLENGRTPAEVRGLSFKKNGEYYHTPDRESYQNMDQLPTPDFSLIENYKKFSYVPLQTSRGCPHDCEFCSVVQMYGKKIRYRNPGLIEKDLDEMSNFYNLNKQNIFFVDDNFSINESRTESLLKRIMQNDYKLQWSTQEEVGIYRKNRILELMKKAGCTRLHIGIESFSPASLKEYNKPQNQSEIKKAITTVHDHGISIHGMFVIGSESDTENSIMETVQNAIDQRIDTAQFFILVPIPGTRIFRKIKDEGRLLIDKIEDWSLFDGHHVVFNPKNMSPYELQKLQLKAFKKFYSIKRSWHWFKEGEFKNIIPTLYGRWALQHWKKKSTDFLNRLRQDFT